jgi:hypothetical protein
VTGDGGQRPQPSFSDGSGSLTLGARCVLRAAAVLHSQAPPPWLLRAEGSCGALTNKRPTLMALLFLLDARRQSRDDGRYRARAQWQLLPHSAHTGKRRLLPLLRNSMRLPLTVDMACRSARSRSTCFEFLLQWNLCG